MTLTQKDRDRLVILRQLADGTHKLSEAARRLGLSSRQARRLRRRFEGDGDAAVIHALRGRPSNRRLPEELRTKALAKAREPLYADFAPTLLSEHLDRDPGIGFVHPSTLRLWMIGDGRWVPSKRKNRHRRRRERRAAYGELVLMDTSIHSWLENRSGEEIVLIALIDDATSRLFCRFFPRDTGAANRQLLVDYLQSFGRMRAVYADRAGHFEAHFRSSQRREEDQEKALTLIEKALGSLEIELIHALSPQAKGRVERLFGTLQDRLIKEMRVAGIDSLEAANCFLEDHFIPFWEGRFTVEPAEKVDAHLPLPEGVDLQRVFADTDQRVIRNDFTFRYKNQHYQIERSEADGAMPATRLTIERRLDGSLCFRWRERYLQPSPIAERPRPEPEPKVASPKKAARPGRPIPPDHPWRKRPFLVGKSVHRPPQVVASAPAALQPVSPALVGAAS